jgi:hypothetical protein
MLLKSILKKIVQYIDANPDEFGCKHIKYCVQMANEANGSERSIEEFITTLDPRDIGVLRDYVPKAFPRHLRPPVELQVYQNNLGAWRVDPKLKETVDG